VTSGTYQAENGVREGSVLSPTLFIMFINGLLQQLNASGRGVAVHGNNWMGAVLYADDIILMAKSAKELGEMLKIVTTYFKNWRIMPNQSKSHVVVFDHSPGARLRRKGGVAHAQEQSEYVLDGQTLEEHDSYKYLGVWLEHNFRFDKQLAYVREAVDRVLRVAQRMGAQQGKLEPWMARLIVESTVAAKMTYAMGFWVYRTSDEQGLQSRQWAATRTLLGLPGTGVQEYRTERELGMDYVVTRRVRSALVSLRLVQREAEVHA
jgi:hypothetical protein